MKLGMLRLFFVSVFLLGSIAFATLAVDAEVPFWRAKPELLRRMREDRVVVVSARRSDVTTVSGAHEIRFTIKGAGIVSAPRGFAFKESQNYTKLKDISSYFKKVEYDASSRKLHFVAEVLGFVEDADLIMTPVSVEKRDELQWTIVRGDFKGMTGVLGFEQDLGGKTEVSIDAVYQASTLPLPKILMGVALEAVFQKVAEKLRTAIETEFKKGASARRDDLHVTVGAASRI
jgi:hypothetical protein